MKTLYILRHGKSAWDDPSLKDRQRPLMPKGIKRTQKLAGMLKERALVPDALWSSDAVRARETAEIVQKTLGLDHVFIDADIYDAADDGALLQWLETLPDEYDNILVVGHNTVLTDLVNRWLPRRIDNLPTAGLVCSTFDIPSWLNLPTARCTESFLLLADDD